MRLGGIAHAARGLWASNIPYAVAAICPAYLRNEAEAYLKAHGCVEFIHIGEVIGAPNIILINDVRETANQGYESLLRDSKETGFLREIDKISLYDNAIIFPGSYALNEVISKLQDNTRITIDIAYDIKSINDLSVLSKKITNLAISTSSDLFLSIAHDSVDPLISAAKSIGVESILLKENRGGSRLFMLTSNQAEEITAQLDITINSVGVGDAFTAVLAAYPTEIQEAAWRGAQVATRYAQTTFPDDLRRDVRRDLALQIDEVRQLGGVSLPWHERKQFPIYLAAPDFSYMQKPEIDAAIAALEYHNFLIRRPVLENGEASQLSPSQDLRRYYEKDLSLLKECLVVFAIPLERDPGTLVETGMAIMLNKPVITYDPRCQNNNTMIICGSQTYSTDLDICLNGLFECISVMRKRKK